MTSVNQNLAKVERVLNQVAQDLEKLKTAPPVLEGNRKPFSAHITVTKLERFRKLCKQRNIDIREGAEEAIDNWNKEQSKALREKD